MQRIWDHGGTVTVRDLFEELREERNIAYTTVMSTMDNLHRKGWLARERAGKAYRYWPTLTREEHSARLMLEPLGSGAQSFRRSDQRGGVGRAARRAASADLAQDPRGAVNIAVSLMIYGG